MSAYQRRSGSLAKVAAIFFLGCVSALSLIIEVENNLGRIIGIHLGTTYSSVGVYKNGLIEIIRNEQGKRTTPSWVAFTNNETLIGEAAKDQATFNRERTVFHVKRLIGRKFDDEEVQRAIKLLPYKIVNIDGNPYIKVIMEDGETKFFSPEEIIAMILVKMKEIAEAFVGVKIEKAVLTVPAYFNDAQRQATVDAGVIAGLDVVEIIDEPTAAVIGYGMAKKGSVSVKNILVFDLGAATFDVTILAIDNSDFEVLVLAKTGDQYLGGDNFDYRITEYFINLIKKKHGKDISNENRTLDKLRRESERAKIALSTFMEHQVHVEIESLFGGTNFSQTLTRVQFEELNNDLFRKTMDLVKKVMDDAGLQKNQIDDIALVGGSTRIPKVQQLLQDYFGRIELNKGVYSDVNPDEAVARGGAIRGEILRDHVEPEVIYLLPVIQNSYGIETAGGVMTKLIPSGTPDFLSITRSHVFTTHQDLQTTVSIKVFQGENGFTKNCRLIGKFKLSGIPPAPRGTPRIKVTFELGVNYQLSVKAEDKATGRAEYIIVNSWSSNEVIERMLKKGAEIGDEIMKLNDAFDSRNRFEIYIRNLRDQINDEDKLAGKLEYHEKEIIESIIERAYKWLHNNLFSEKEHHQNKLKEIEGICKPIITALYQKEPHVTHST